MIIRGGLVPPDGPVFPNAAAEQFKIRPPTAFLDNLILLVWFSRMLPLSCRYEIHLASSWIKSAGTAPSHSKQDQFGYIPEVEAYPSPVRSAILPDLVPDNICLVLEPPRAEHLQAHRQQSIRDPQIAMGAIFGMPGHRQVANLP